MHWAARIISVSLLFFCAAASASAAQGIVLVFKPFDGDPAASLQMKSLSEERGAFKQSGIDLLVVNVSNKSLTKNGAPDDTYDVPDLINRFAAPGGGFSIAYFDANGEPVLRRTFPIAGRCFIRVSELVNNQQIDAAEAEAKFNLCAVVWRANVAPEE